VPIHSDEKSTTITIVLGYGDIAIGNIDDPKTGHKGVGFELLERAYAYDEKVPPEAVNKDWAPRVFLSVRDERGLAQLRRAVNIVARSLGVDDSTVGAAIMDHYLEIAGAERQKVEKLRWMLGNLFEELRHGEPEHEARLKEKIDSYLEGFKEEAAVAGPAELRDYQVFAALIHQSIMPHETGEGVARTLLEKGSLAYLESYLRPDELEFILPHIKRIRLEHRDKERQARAPKQSEEPLPP
jgi:hypothetical protein